MGWRSMVSQLVPVYSGRQAQVYAFTPSVQVPPCWHGCGAQSSMFVVHVVPVYPVAQVHVKESTPSAQVPPFWQGLAAQSSMFVWHVAPVYPAAQVHVQSPPATDPDSTPPFTQAAHGTVFSQ